MAQSAELLNTLPEPGALTTAIYFPDHPTKQFPAGDVVSSNHVVPVHHSTPTEAFFDARLLCLALSADNCCDQCTQRQHQVLQLDRHCGLSELPNGLQHVHSELHTPGKPPGAMPDMLHQ
jgi:hypothetical protein